MGWKLYIKGEDGLAKGLGLGFVMCILVTLVNNLFGDRWTYWEISAYFWVFAGLVVRLNLMREKGGKYRLYRKKEELRD